MKIVRRGVPRLTLPPADVVALLGLSVLAAYTLGRTVDLWWPLWSTLLVGGWVFAETATRTLRLARRRRRDLARWQSRRAR